MKRDEPLQFPDDREKLTKRAIEADDGCISARNPDLFSKIDNQTMAYNFGEVCEHGTLKRKCDDCWHAWTEALLREKIAELDEVANQYKTDAEILIREVKAWRRWLVENDKVGGEVDLVQCELNAAMAETDKHKLLKY